jgi:hypothetical protein
LMTCPKISQSTLLATSVLVSLVCFEGCNRRSTGVTDHSTSHPNARAREQLAP